MHIVKLLEHRFPKHKPKIIAALLFLSTSLILLGLGFLIH
jgi:hypothetical protein